jgi:squalene-associated FAD-dependent desaturase
MTHVAVIGGGYAGMAAAVTLAEQRVPVTVFEAGRQLGGRARRIDYRDVALDNGLHILIGAYVETLRLIKFVNPAHDDALQRVPLEWRVQGEFHLRAARLPAPLHLLIGLLRADGLSITEKFSAARMLVALRLDRYTLAQDITVENLLTWHRQCEKLRRVLWRPLCVAALNTPPDLASAQVFLNVLRDALDATRAASDLVFARTDLSALFPDPAATFVEQHGGTVLRSKRVTAIDPLDTGFEIRADDHRTRFTHVICAISAHQVNAFLIGISALSDIVNAIERLQYQPIYSVWLQYPAAVSLPHPMLGLTQGLIHWVFDREKLCGQRGLIGAVISASGEHEVATLDELGLRVHGELQKQVGNLPAPLWTRVIAEKRATFACVPDVRRPPQVTPLTNFYLAGDYTASDYPGTLESAMRSGVTCARHILQRR